jgi:G:T-mismatch repair DNA endonuclease (very short patch repair protein)
MKKGSHHTLEARRILAEKAFVITTAAWVDPDSALRNREDAWITRRANGSISGRLKGKTYEEIYGVEGARKRMEVVRNPNTWRGFNTSGEQRSTQIRAFWGRVKADPQMQAALSRNMSVARQRMWDAMTEHDKSKRIRNVAEGNQTRPTKAEDQLRLILEANYPSEYAYNGDCGLGVVLAGMIPDFINVNGKKQVIEMFGDYWHSDRAITSWRRGELGRVMTYNALGFRCLIIWEHELKDTEKLLSKIKAFRRSKKL